MAHGSTSTTPNSIPSGTRAHRLKLPVFIHTADPQEFFEPIDYKNERWLEFALFADRRYPPDRFPTFAELMAERDNLFRKHPRTTFVAFQDRMLFGKDSFEPAEYPYFWRVFRDARCVLRRLPRLPRVLEAVRHRLAGRGAEEGLLL